MVSAKTFPCEPRVIQLILYYYVKQITFIIIIKIKLLLFQNDVN